MIDKINIGQIEIIGIPIKEFLICAIIAMIILLTGITLCRILVKWICKKIGINFDDIAIDPFSNEEKNYKENGSAKLIQDNIDFEQAKIDIEEDKDKK